MARPFSTWILGNRLTQFRLAIVLLAMFFAVLASKLWEDSYIENLRRDCGSLFYDRLMPATMLFHLADQLYQKRETLQSALQEQSGTNQDDVHYALGQHDASLERILGQIEKTYLVKVESDQLHLLRDALGKYREQEKRLLKAHAEGRAVSYDKNSQEAFFKVRQHLLKLTEVQETVGRELEQDSESSAANVEHLLYFQLGVAFILGLVASGLAVSLGAPVGRKENSTDLH